MPAERIRVPLTALLGVLLATPALGAGLSRNARAIQAAIDGAEAGDVIQLPPGEIRGTLRIDKPITVRGAGIGITRYISNGKRASLMIEGRVGTTVVEGISFTTSPDALSRRGAGVMVSGPGEVTLRDIELQRSIAGRCLTSAITLQRSPTVRMERVVVRNHACYMAGALVVPKGADVTLSQCEFRQNKGELAGAILVTGGRLRIERTTFEGNRHARGDDGHHLVVGPGRSHIELVASSFRTDPSTSVAFEAGAEPRFTVSGMAWPEPRRPEFVVMK